MSTRRASKRERQQFKGCFFCVCDYAILADPQGLAAILSQVRWDVKQKKRLKELTLIHFDRACLKNENTFQWVSFQFRCFVEGSAEKHNIVLCVESWAVRMRDCLWNRLVVHWSLQYSEEDVHAQRLPDAQRIEKALKWEPFPSSQ